MSHDDHLVQQIKTVEAHDLACLTRIRMWAVLYLIIGLCFLLLFGVVEPLFIGTAMAVNRYTSDPLFSNLVLGQIELERPFTPPGMLNSLLGACHVPWHVPPPLLGGGDLLRTKKDISADEHQLKTRRGDDNECS